MFSKALILMPFCHCNNTGSLLNVFNWLFLLRTSLEHQKQLHILITQATS